MPVEMKIEDLMGEHQSREIEKFSPIVKCANLNKDCEGCQAARRVLDINQHTNAMAVKKVKEQYKQIQQLQADKKELKNKWDECRIVNSYIVEQSTKLHPEDFLNWIVKYDLKPGKVQYEEAKNNGTWEKHQDSTQE